MTFHFAEGLSSFGVGLVDMYYSQSILINGVELLADITADGNFDTVGLNLYLRIDREAGDAAISSVQFQQFGAASGDGYGFDHLAVKQVPAPMTAAMVLSGLAGIRLRRLPPVAV